MVEANSLCNLLLAHQAQVQTSSCFTPTSKPSTHKLSKGKNKLTDCSPPARCKGWALKPIQTRKQSFRNQVLIHSWVERVHMQVKCLAQGHSATLKQLRPAPLLPKWQTVAITSPRSAFIWSLHSDIGTRIVVTARELVVVSAWFIYIRHNVSGMAPPSTWSLEPWEIRNLQCWRARNKPPQPSPTTGLEPRPLGLRGAHATSPLRYWSFLQRTPHRSL